MEKQRSQAYAIVALAFALYNISSSLLQLSWIGTSFRILYSSSLVYSSLLGAIIAIVFGILGLKSSNRKTALAAIIIGGVNILMYPFVFFVLPWIRFILDPNW